MKKLVLMLAMVMGVSTTANAGIMLEPYLGYEWGETDGVETKGSLIGGRAAYELDLVAVSAWFGLDVSKSVSMDYDYESTSTSADLTRVGLVAGVEFPIFIRAWAGYNLINSIEVDSASKVDGKAVKAGVGFTALPFVSLNLEYIKSTYEGSNGAADTDHDTYMVSVSLPLSF